MENKYIELENININASFDIIELDKYSEVNFDCNTSLDDLLKKIDEMIERSIYYLGFNNRIIKKSKFSSKEYYEILKDYDRDYYGGNIYSKELEEQSFKYIKDYLNNRVVVTKLDNNNLIVSNDGDINALRIVLELINKKEIELKYLDKFVEYLKVYEQSLVLK